MTFGCKAGKGNDNFLPRPQPGYTAWLERQSMAHQAEALISQVSQTERVWMFSGQGKDVNLLLDAAPQWLEVTSDNLDNHKFLTGLSTRISQIPRGEIQGLYLGALGEDQSHWLTDEMALRSGKRMPASLELDARLGETDDLERLLQSSERAGLELGASLPAGSTSMGPDFFLQARNVTGHTGLYAMLEIPRNFWEIVPKTAGEWECAALSPLQIQEASARGLIPQKLYRDEYAWAPQSGWAVTGEVTGSDAKVRRWLYRYENNVKSPVMLWQDPSGLAKKIFSAAVIQQTGFWQMSLTGLRLAALMGLEPHVQEEKENVDLATSFSPGLEALDLLSDQIHRYGGWSLQADSLPKELVELVLAGKCDFCREDISARLVRKALETQDPGELADLFRNWLAMKVDQKRMARGFEGSATKPVSTPDRVPFALEAMLGWRIGLPGLVFFSPGEIDLDWSLSDANSEQPLLENSEKLKKILVLRKRHQLAKGNLILVMEGGSASIGILSRLPDGAFWLLATNFGENREELVIKLPEKCKAALDIVSSNELSKYLTDGGQKFSIPLDGPEVRHVILYME